jgi:hypothetical protein
MNFVVISHQTGAGLLMFPFHTIELTKKTRDPVKDQAMYNRVPTLRALQCHGRGRMMRNIDMGAMIWKAMLVAVIAREMVLVIDR